MIKTTEDVELLEKYLFDCFDHKDTYFLVDITDKPIDLRILIQKTYQVGWITYNGFTSRKFICGGGNIAKRERNNYEDE